MRLFSIILYYYYLIFHIRQSSQWKKYIEAGKNAEQIRSNDFERVRDKQSPRRTDKKRSTGNKHFLMLLKYLKKQIYKK